jgi:pimeloyl-ACP methyl ester carboxylesterase
MQFIHLFDFYLGLDGAVSFFNDIIPELTLYFNVIVYYLPIVSEKSWLPGSSEFYTFQYLSSDLIDALQTSLPLKDGEKVILMGESFGAILSLQYAVDYPDFLSHMILISPIAKPELTFEIELKYHILRPLLFYGIGALFPKVAQQIFALIHGLIHSVLFALLYILMNLSSRNS